MKTPDLFRENKESWLEQWLESVISTYPAESSRFFKDTRDPFANPVGATLRKGLADLYEVLTATEFNPEAATEALMPMVRLRSVQEFTPAEALGFLFRIKEIMASCAKPREKDNAFDDAMAEIARRIDTVVLLSFNLYWESKKRVYLLRAKEARNCVNRLLIKKGLMSELPDIDPELGE